MMPSLASRVALLTVTSFVACVISLASQAPNSRVAAPKQTSEQSPQQSSSPADTSKDTEIAALKAQLETMWRYDQRLLNTVNYGLLAILFVATAGSVATFVNSRRELTSLQQQIRQGLSAASQELKNTFDQHDIELGRREGERRDEVVRIHKELSGRVDTYQQKVGELLTADRKSTDARTRALLKEQSRTLTDQLNLLKHILADFLASHFAAQPTRAFRHRLESITAKLDMGWSDYLGDELADLANTLEKGAKISDVVLPELQSMLNRLPDKYGVDRAKLQALIPRGR
jgi:hypothetical protein